MPIKCTVRQYRIVVHQSPALAHLLRSNYRWGQTQRAILTGWTTPMLPPIIRFGIPTRPPGKERYQALGVPGKNGIPTQAKREESSKANRSFRPVGEFGSGHTHPPRRVLRCSCRPPGAGSGRPGCGTKLDRCVVPRRLASWSRLGDPCHVRVLVAVWSRSARISQRNG